MGNIHQHWDRRLPFALAIVLIMSFAGSTLLSQETRATIAGRVTDPTGGVIPGVSITVTNLDTNVSNAALSNDSGLFEVPFLMPGQYTVTAELAGFKKYVRQGIALNVGAKINLDIKLDVGEVSESVTVTAQEPLLDTTSASIGQV